MRSRDASEEAILRLKISAREWSAGLRWAVLALCRIVLGASVKCPRNTAEWNRLQRYSVQSAARSGQGAISLSRLRSSAKCGSTPAARNTSSSPILL